MGETYLMPFRTRQRAWQILTKISEEIVGTKISAHKYRHTCGFILVNNDTPINVIADHLGHVNINITRRYSMLKKEKVKKHFDKAFEVQENG